MNHQFDVWHFSKSMKTELLIISKKKACEELRLSQYVIIFGGHLQPVNKLNYLKEKWISLLFHNQNKHCWTRHALYHQCSYADLSTEEERSKVQLSPESKSFLALQTIVLEKTFQRHGSTDQVLIYEDIGRILFNVK